MRGAVTLLPFMIYLFIAASKAGTMDELMRLLSYHEIFHDREVQLCDPPCTSLCRFSSVRLLNNNVSVTTVSSSFECQRACHQHPDCDSTNVHKSSGRCELNRATPNLKRSQFVEDPEYEFWSIMVC